MKENKEHFFVVGAQRSGTTYLYNVLDEHPQIFMAKPVRPEPKFFLSEDFGKGVKFYENKYFSEIDDKVSVLGEKSTSYYENESMPNQIKFYFPDAKIIFSLRDPVYRAISNYYFSVKNGLEKRTIKEVFLDNVPPGKYPDHISTDPFDYLGRGENVKFVKKYLECFDKKNVKVLIFERFIGNIGEVQNLYEYIGVNKEFCPESLNKKVNSGNMDSEVDAEIIKELKRYFSPYNDALEELLNEKITEWL